MAKPSKVSAVAELTDKFRGSSAAVVTEYRGLSVAQLKQLRTGIKENATYAVVKNTLTSIAAKQAGVDVSDAHLTGPSAIAFAARWCDAAATSSCSVRLMESFSLYFSVELPIDSWSKASVSPSWATLSTAPIDP